MINSIYVIAQTFQLVHKKTAEYYIEMGQRVISQLTNSQLFNLPAVEDLEAIHAHIDLQAVSGEKDTNGYNRAVDHLFVFINQFREKQSN